MDPTQDQLAVAFRRIFAEKNTNRRRVAIELGMPYRAVNDVYKTPFKRTTDELIQVSNHLDHSFLDVLHIASKVNA